MSTGQTTGPDFIRGLRRLADMPGTSGTDSRFLRAAAAEIDRLRSVLATIEAAGDLAAARIAREGLRQ